MKIFNTLSRKKEDFKTIEKNKVRMYVCGPTVYNYFHIGNARTFSFFDVVKNYFKFKGYQVVFVQNLTDIDDKLIEQSIKEDKPVGEIAEKYIQAFFQDIQKLNMEKATHYPRATEYISEMISFIENLVKKGFAYERNGDVYFSVKNSVDYGKLSGKKLDELKIGARVEENVQKKHPADFTLWKKAKPQEPSWQSPWGRGRPGWHTECVVMSRKLLGETIDIHGGAIDLIFPHHENELAQAAATSRKPFVNYWMHGGFLNFAGDKMSKSLDNFFFTRDVLKKFDADTIRFFFLTKHYRSQIEYSEKMLQEAGRAMKGFYNVFRDVDFLSHLEDRYEYSNEQTKLKEEFIRVMDDDFNTAKAIAVLFEISKKINTSNKTEKKLYAHLLYELGLVLGFFSGLETRLKNDLDVISEDLIDLMIKYRAVFKLEKNWKLADLIRSDLDRLGISIKDTAEGSEWYFQKRE